MMRIAVIPAVAPLDEVAWLKIETIGLGGNYSYVRRECGGEVTYPIVAVLSWSTSWTENNTHIRNINPLANR
jgi:hypothetical protein